MSDQQWEFKKARDFGESSSARLRSVNREQTLVEYCIGSVWHFLLKSYLRTVHSFKIEGRHNIPTELPFVLIANHTSHLDALCLAAALPVSPRSLRSKVHPIAASDTFFSSGVQSFFSASAVNALPLTRRDSDQAKFEISDLRARIREGDCGFMLFPEGTRSRTGEMNVFKRGIGKLVAETAVPVIPCYIHGAFEAFPPNARVPRLKPISLTAGPGITFADVENIEDGWQRIALILENAVRDLRSKVT